VAVSKQVKKTGAKTKSKPVPKTKSAAKNRVKSERMKSEAAKTKTGASAKKALPAKAPVKISENKTPEKTSANAKTPVYDESKIKTLSSLEHIRLRTGMYIGRLGDGSNPDDGIYVLLKEIIDNGVDEFIMGNGKLIDISVKDIDKTGKATVKVRDFGRGIPLGKLVECVSVINTGAKYNDDVFQFSVGLNGVGTKAVNALSVHFRVAAIRSDEFAEAVFERGNLKSERKGRLKEKVRTGL